MESRVLMINDLYISFALRGRRLYAVRGAELDILRGTTLAVVGESGSGKSVLAKAVIGLIDPNGRIDSGSIWLAGNRIDSGSPPRDHAAMRKNAAIILQDPMTSLNPLRRVGSQIAEAVRIRSGSSRADAAREAVRLLRSVGIARASERARQYPHEFSGGMRQRAVIACAVACRPKLLICDEPTTALDVTVQARIIDLLKELKKELNLTIMFITHDLGVVAAVADEVAVMYAGEVVERGTAEEVFYDPRHPYTWALLSSLPQLGRRGRPLHTISGSPPTLFEPPVGDAFAPRNPYALNIDFERPAPVFRISPTHTAKTWLLDPRAPKARPPAGAGLGG